MDGSAAPGSMPADIACTGEARLPSGRHAGWMVRRKTTVTIDEELQRLAKVAAARSGRRGYEVFEEALRQPLSLDVLDRVWARSADDPIDDDAAMTLARRAPAEVRARGRARSASHS